MGTSQLFEVQLKNVHNCMHCYHRDLLLKFLEKAILKEQILGTRNDVSLE